MIGRIGHTALTAILLAACGLAAAEAKKAATKPAKEASTPAETTPKQIAQWVKDMDHDRSNVRDAAVKQLIGAGKAAIGPVAEAAKGDSLEVTVRAVTVLKGLLSCDDAATRKAAEAALQDLAAGKDHESARQARAALTAARPKPRRHPGLMGNFVVGGNIAVAGGQGVTISVTNRNGNREVNVTENGRKIRIIENAKDGITVTVTEPGEGKDKPKPKEYKAANADELKKKHPEAHKLYKKYAAGNRINIGAVQMRAMPGIVVGPRMMRARINPVIIFNGDETRKKLAEAKKLLEQVAEKLKAAKANLDAKTVAEILQQLAEAQKGLAEVQKSVK